MSYVIDTEAFKEAVAYAQKKHRGHVSSDLLTSLIQKIASKKARMVFFEALRFSLNEICTGALSTKRDLYRSAASKYFSLRSGKVRRARASSSPSPAKTQQRVTGKVFLEPLGHQYAFKI